MNILALVKLYFHRNKSGGEAYLHHFLKHLLNKYPNFKIRVLIPSMREMKKYEFEKIEIIETTEDFKSSLLYCNKSDLVISQLDFAFETINYCLDHKIPIIKIFHNSIDQYNKFIENPNIIKIFNSKYTKNDYIKRGLMPVNDYIIYPYTDFKKLSKYKNNTENRDYITLINPSENKGANIVLKLAQKLTREKFLIVKGGYYPHHQKPFLDQFKNLPNCHIIENTSDIINNIFLKTKILLQPSNYETYGMCASEASCFGIPTIINKNSPGLLENMTKLSLGGIDNQIDTYLKVIKSLEVPENYFLWCNLSFDKAEQRYFEIENQLDYFCENIFN